MTNFDLIREAYWQVEKHFITIMDDATSQMKQDEYLRVQEWSRINEYAYFVLFWGQFESFINSRAVEIEDDALGMGFMLGDFQQRIPRY
jgi:hypothetical protein